MNVDYILTPSPATARKLVTLKSMVRLDIDPDILRVAGEGLLSAEDVQPTLHPSLLPYLNERTLDIIQHSVDHSDRFILGTRTFAQSAAYSLMAAYYSGEKILVIGGKDQKFSDQWRAFFNQHGMTYLHLKTDADAVDNEAPILLVEDRALTHSVIQKNRNRFLVYVEHASTALVSPGFSLDDLFVLSTSPYSTTAMEISREFPKCVLSFHMNPNSGTGKPTEWWLNKTVREQIRAQHPELNVDHVFSNTQSNQNTLMNMGFMMHSPMHMARMLGMHLRILVEDPPEKHVNNDF